MTTPIEYMNSPFEDTTSTHRTSNDSTESTRLSHLDNKRKIRKIAVRPANRKVPISVGIGGKKYKHKRYTNKNKRTHSKNKKKN